ncbi:hypothetical protein GCM10010495_35740 [Kitasatospora herbaricolor]|nr:hypothetical protein GCM10010495_35740 [Kitasatospora herbaricolor]
MVAFRGLHGNIIPYDKQRALLRPDKPRWEIRCLATASPPVLRGNVRIGPVGSAGITAAPVNRTKNERQVGRPSGNITSVVYGAMHPVPETLAPSANHHRSLACCPTTAARRSQN